MNTFSPPIEIAAWLACLAFLAWLINQVLKIVDRMKDKPAPGEVRAEAIDRFVHKSDFQKFKEDNLSEHKELFLKIGGVERSVTERLEHKIDESIKSAEVSRSALHQRINRITIGVARLCGRSGVPMPKEDEEV
jgi:hypothetical protein